jgi:hypothetical protein
MITFLQIRINSDVPALKIIRQLRSNSAIALDRRTKTALGTEKVYVWFTSKGVLRDKKAIVITKTSGNDYHGPSSWRSLLLILSTHSRSNSVKPPGIKLSTDITRIKDDWKGQRIWFSVVGCRALLYFLLSYLRHWESSVISEAAITWETAVMYELLSSRKSLSQMEWLWQRNSPFLPLQDREWDREWR